MGCYPAKQKIYNSVDEVSKSKRVSFINLESNSLNMKENQYEQKNTGSNAIEIETHYQSPVGEVNEETNNNIELKEKKTNNTTQEQQIILKTKNFFQQVEEMQLQMNYILIDNEEYQQINNENSNQQQLQKKVVYINKGNNSSLIKQYFANKKNWLVVDWSSKYSFLFSLKWTQFAYQVEWNLYKEDEQIVNHVKGAYETFCTKCSMAQLLKDHEQQNKNNQEINSNKFYPKTFILEYGKKTYSDDEKQFLELQDSETIWLSKPTDELGGKGIEIIQQISDFRILFQRYKGLSQHYKPQLIQKYIANPLLLEGKKFDIRCFVLIASTKPFLVLFHQGFVYRSLKQYVSPKENSDRSIHIANILLQKKDPNYQKKRNEIGWSMERFSNYLQQYYGLSTSQIEEIDLQIKKIICYTIKCGLTGIKRMHGCFELFGCDVTLDDKFNVFLYEINENPGLTYDCQVERELYPQLVFSTLDIIMDINQNKSALTERLKKNEIDFKAFSVLINEAKNLSLI